MHRTTNAPGVRNRVPMIGSGGGDGVLLKAEDVAEGVGEPGDLGTAGGGPDG